MKHKKKLSRLFLATIMTLGISSCSNVKETPNNPVEPDKTEPDKTPDENPKLKFDSKLENARIIMDGYLNYCDIYVLNNEWYLSKKDIKKIIQMDISQEYISLNAFAKSENLKYTKDETLKAAYFNSWGPYEKKIDFFDFESYAKELNIQIGDLSQNTISGKEMAKLLDCFVIHEAPDKMQEWYDISVNFRLSEEPLKRTDALAGLFLASWKIGGIYLNYGKENHSWNIREAAFDKESDNRNWGLFDYYSLCNFDLGYGILDHYGCASCLFNIGIVSPVDGSFPFSYEEGSFRFGENSTYLEALLAILRTFSIKDGSPVLVDDPTVITPSKVLTKDILTKASIPSFVTSENHPRWTGFALNADVFVDINEVVDQISLSSNWGFNSARLNIEYEQLFDRDVKNANLLNFFALDRIIAESIKNNMHLNLCLVTLPGRWRNKLEEFGRFGEYDLYLNKEKQKQAKLIFEILTKRYKDISNDYLSFTPVWEPMNYNLGTGESYEPYTATDYANCLADIVDTIRNIDNKRLIIFEMTNNSGIEDIKQHSEPIIKACQNKTNIIYSYNFCENPFVYTSMSGRPGSDPDIDNSSYFLAQYPTYYYDLDRYIVDTNFDGIKDIFPNKKFDGNGSLFIDGCLPAGTTIDLYLDRTYGGDLKFIADNQEIYNEKLDYKEYEYGATVSSYIQYAMTEKKISVSLNKDVDLLEIATPGGGLSWTGMDIYLPKEYEKESWYFVSPYDVSQGIEEKDGIRLIKSSRVMIWPCGEKEHNITIHDDLTYSTPTVSSSASKETITKMIQTVDQYKKDSIIRYERANFAGVICKEMMEYYTDMFSVLEEYNIGWWSNDWYVMTNDMSNEIVGVKQINYRDYKCFNLELLELMQQYQVNDRP